MRSLIRPTLFLITRLGLFLAVVAWIVGQWWQVYTGIPGQLRAEFNNLGWAIVHSSYNPDNELFVRSNFAEERQVPRHFFFPPRGVATNFCGIVFGHKAQLHWVSFRHGLIVTIFTLFNGVLVWIYRKRGEPEHDPAGNRG